MSKTTKLAVDPIGRTKLHRPPPPKGLVDRPRPLDRLNDALLTPVTLVAAPAGYGKSVLISQWVESLDMPCAWLSLDEADSDLTTFLRYLIAAIKSAHGDVCTETEAYLTSPTQPPIPVIAKSLTNELDTIDEPLLLVLDDYHLVAADSEVHEILDRLLAHPPGSLRLVIATRRDPAIGITKIRAGGLLTELRMNDLRFDEQESSALFRGDGNLELSEASIARARTAVEGWAAGLHLASLALRRAKDPADLVSQMGSGLLEVQEYLLQEVLAGQSAAMRSWLLRTSILNRLHPELCEALFETADPRTSDLDGETFIRAIRTENLFAIPLDARGEWLRYHHLFQHLLQQQLARHEDRESIARLHRIASDWLHSNGIVGEAIRHALASGDEVRASKIVVQERRDALDRDDWRGLQMWLAMLPPAIKKQNLELLLSQAWVNFQRLDFSAIFANLEEIDRALRETVPDPSLSGEIDFFRGYCEYFLGDAVNCEAHLKSACDQITDHGCVHSEATLHYALALHMNGKNAEALAELSDRLHGDYGTSADSRLWAGLAFIQSLEASLVELRQSAAMVCANGVAGKSRYAESWGHYLSGLGVFLQNDLAAADSSFHSVDNLRHYTHSRAAIDSLIGLAYIRQAEEEFEIAETFIQAALDFAMLLRDQGLIAIANSARARLMLQRGDIGAAASLRQATDFGSDTGSMIWWIEVPRITECRILIAERTPDTLGSAIDLLTRYEKENSALYNKLRLIEILLLECQAYEALSEVDKSLGVLREAVSLARPGNVIRPFVELWPSIADPLRQLAEMADPELASAGDLTFVHRLVEECQAPVAPTSPRAEPAKPKQARSREEPDFLTQREVDILELLAKRLQNKEIADVLCISTHTVNDHLKHIYQKLGINNRRKAVARAESMGILDRV